MQKREVQHYVDSLGKEKMLLHHMLTICFLLISILCIQGAGITSPVQAAEKPGSPEMTNVRWAVSNDAVTGVAKLRLVFDVSGPVQVSSSMSASPSPRLTVDIKGAGRGSVPDTLDFDGNFINKVSVVEKTEDTSTLLVDIPTVLGDGDYRVFTLRNDPAAKRPYRIVIDINKPVPPVIYHFTPGLEDKVIVLDPGHGGSDPGAIGLGGTYEKTITLAVAGKVKKLLEKAGAEVIMTRQDDCDVAWRNATDVAELSARTSVANNKKADIFISIHTNAFTNRTVGGAAVYYSAKSMYDSLLAQSLDSALTQNSKFADRGIYRGNLYVTKNTLMPAALLEMAFISNPNEEKLLCSPVVQQQIAQNIVNGLDRFFAEAARLGGN
ncbi:MAG: amiC 1 [Firmicutes bacterium]|nr:amiC 1 [Bacillota bacterium]